MNRSGFTTGSAFTAPSGFSSEGRAPVVLQFRQPQYAGPAYRPDERKARLVHAIYDEGPVSKGKEKVEKKKKKGSAVTLEAALEYCFNSPCEVCKTLFHTNKKLEFEAASMRVMRTLLEGKVKNLEANEKRQEGVRKSLLNRESDLSVELSQMNGFNRELNNTVDKLKHQKRKWKKTLKEQDKHLLAIQQTRNEAVLSVLKLEKEMRRLEEELDELRPLTKEKLKQKRMGECVCCMDKERDTIFLPCGHLSCCGTCATKLPKGKCPICRKKFKDFKKVVLS